jgi:hypothetical protein
MTFYLQNACCTVLSGVHALHASVEVTQGLQHGGMHHRCYRGTCGCTRLELHGAPVLYFRTPSTGTGTRAPSASRQCPLQSG